MIFLAKNYHNIFEFVKVLPKVQSVLFSWTRCSYNGILIMALHVAFSRMSFRMTLSGLEWLSEIFNDTKHRAASLRRLSFLLVLTTDQFLTKLQKVVWTRNTFCRTRSLSNATFSFLITFWASSDIIPLLSVATDGEDSKDEADSVRGDSVLLSGARLLWLRC